MSGNGNKFDKKYNFDLNNDVKPSQKNQDENKMENSGKSKEVNTFQENKMQIKNMIDELDKRDKDIKVFIEVAEVPNDEEKKKIIIDSKSYSQNLKRKVKLNYNLLRLYYKNFYHDNFNLSRKASYLIFGLPGSVILFFSTILPNHPLLGISLNVSIIASIASFVYFYKQDMDSIASNKNSELGRKIRMIKNELVLYNPLANPILTEDEKDRKNYKI